MLNMDEVYDLIVLDLNMPISDGFEACQKILAHYNDQNKLLDVNMNVRKLNFKDIKPIIIGVTASNLTPELL
jgi:CheY-like chemotaxis protein